MIGRTTPAGRDAAWMRAYTSPHVERACNHGRARGFDSPTRIRTSVSGSKALRAWPNYTMGLRATTDPKRRRFQRADPRRVTNERTTPVAPVGGSDEETPPRGGGVLRIGGAAVPRSARRGQACPTRRDRDRAWRRGDRRVRATRRSNPRTDPASRHRVAGRGVGSSRGLPDRPHGWRTCQRRSGVRVGTWSSLRHPGMPGVGQANGVSDTYPH